MLPSDKRDLIAVVSMTSVPTFSWVVGFTHFIRQNHQVLLSALTHKICRHEESDEMCPGRILSHSGYNMQSQAGISGKVATNKP